MNRRFHWIHKSPEETDPDHVLDLPELNAFADGEGALWSKARNLILAHEYDARMGLGVDDELFEHLGAGGAAGDTIVGAYSQQ